MIIVIALVAQLDRAFGYEPKGQGFESLRARHLIIKKDNKVNFFELLHKILKKA